MSRFEIFAIIFRYFSPFISQLTKLLSKRRRRFGGDEIVDAFSNLFHSFKVYISQLVLERSEQMI